MRVFLRDALKRVEGNDAESLSALSAFGLAFVILLAGAAPRSTQAADYPEKPIRLIVPFAAGNATDAVARLLTEKIQVNTGYRFVIENIPGANGLIGVTNAARSKPDGYTLVIGGAGNFSGNTATRRRPPFDMFKDFIPIYGLQRSAQWLVVKGDSPINSVKDLIELAKQKPGALSFSRSGQAAFMAAELMNAAAGIKLLEIPFKDANQALLAVAMGDVSVSFTTSPALLAMVKNRQLKAIGISGKARNEVLPNVPTIAETLPGFSVLSWLGLFTPAGTPPDIVTKLENTVASAMNDPAFQSKLSSLGLQPWAATPKELNELMVQDLAMWRKFVEIANIPIEP